MKRFFKVLIILMVICFVVMPSAEAWTWNTHSKIVDKAYSVYPSSIRSHLSLSVMRDGSNDPDEIYRDYYYHSYPNSLTKTNYYLSRGKYFYGKRDYYTASKCFGVASHYISDTYSAPHCVSGESSYMHSKYENQGNYLTPRITGVYSMYSGYMGGKTDWNSWMSTQSSSIVQKDLDKGTTAAIVLIRYNVW